MRDARHGLWEDIDGRLAGCVDTPGGCPDAATPPASEDASTATASTVEELTTPQVPPEMPERGDYVPVDPADESAAPRPSVKRWAAGEAARWALLIGALSAATGEPFDLGGDGDGLF